LATAGVVYKSKKGWKWRKGVVSIQEKGGGGKGVYQSIRKEVMVSAVGSMPKTISKKPLTVFVTES
jgi:hypothetical protein